MFSRLTDSFSAAFKKLAGRGRISESALQEALKETRRALLEADVNYKVAQSFLDKVSAKALGQKVLASLSPAQQVIKIVHDELKEMIGGESVGIDFAGAPPLPLMLVGLQGSGKTTTAAKLAKLFLKQNKKPYLIPADVARPAAIAQLLVLAEEIGVPAFPSTTAMTPMEITRLGLAQAAETGRDVAIVDTAGRLTIDEGLMAELSEIKKISRAREILLVADAMTGQEAVNIAKDFNERLDLTGVILTKMEGDARPGSAMSIRSVVAKPLKFIGVGEKLDALEPFHPDRVASLILGMGDVLTLIEKANEHADQKTREELEKKIEKGAFTLADMREQFLLMGKVGTVESILGMIPGLGKLKKLAAAQPNEATVKKFVYIVDSMTPGERRDHSIIDSSRRQRIAKGSGSTVHEVNDLLKNFDIMRGMMKKIKNGQIDMNSLIGQLNNGGFPGGVPPMRRGRGRRPF